VLGAIATVLDSLNPLRNNAAINAARKVFAFLDAKLGTTS